MKTIILSGVAALLLVGCDSFLEQIEAVTGLTPAQTICVAKESIDLAAQYGSGWGALSTQEKVQFAADQVGAVAATCAIVISPDVQIAVEAAITTAFEAK